MKVTLVRSLLPDAVLVAESLLCPHAVTLNNMAIALKSAIIVLAMWVRAVASCLLKMLIKRFPLNLYSLSFSRDMLRAEFGQKTIRRASGPRSSNAPDIPYGA